jgi:Uma2 family endonuclease
MSTITISWLEVVKGLPADSLITLRHIPWEEYEELLVQLGEDRNGLRISYDEGTLQVMTLSPEHEKYVRFFETLMTTIRLRLRLNILSFGSSTMKKRLRSKGTEPDACFYIQTASVIGNRMQLDFATDPPPDVAVEVDMHHGSISKFPIYAALGVPEIWHFDGQQLTIHHLAQESYVVTETSRALPLLTSRILTDFLTRLREGGEFQTILAFDEWLQTQQQ